jgi:signal transduction histidine kinase
MAWMAPIAMSSLFPKRTSISFPYFSVSENLLIPDKVYHMFPLSIKRRLIQEEASALLSGYGFDIDPSAIINNLSLSDRMVIHILRSVYRKPDLLILDAVLEKLAASHLEKILDILSALKKTGTSILCITHSIDDIYGLADKVTILIDKEKMYETIANIEEELTDIKQIVSNLISFSDSNKMVNEEFELNGLIASIINLIRFNAKNKKIRIEYTPAEHPIYLNANMNEIKQVVLNLLKNSFEASDGGGAICIHTSSINVDDRPFACIVFKDDGIGIEDENPDNIFLPFYSTKKGNDANLGLGLSVSYGIVKKYKGNISVKNLKVSGCEFTITLPQ